MTRLSSGGVGFELPPGWEGQIDPGSGTWRETAQDGTTQALPATQADGAVRRVVAHVANFPLPPGRGDFGNGAVQDMRPGDVFIALFEYDPASTATALFRRGGVPDVTTADFDPAALQKPVPGGSAIQRFFQVAGRAFCLYVVVGSHIDRADVVPTIRTLVDGLEIT
jgi:hypothetical protein